MELNRNHYFMLGCVILFLGIQFRLVDSFQLTPEATHVLNKKLGKLAPPPEAQQSKSAFSFASKSPVPEIPPRRTVHPPQWLSWACISIGSVLILHSLAMRAP